MNGAFFDLRQRQRDLSNRVKIYLLAWHGTQASSGGYSVCVYPIISPKAAKCPMLTGTPSSTKNAATKGWLFEATRAPTANTASTLSSSPTRATCKHARANTPTRRVTTTPAGVPHAGHDVAGLSYPVPQAKQIIMLESLGAASVLTRRS